MHTSGVLLLYVLCTTRKTTNMSLPVKGRCIANVHSMHVYTIIRVQQISYSDSKSTLCIHPDHVRVLCVSVLLMYCVHVCVVYMDMYIFHVHVQALKWSGEGVYRCIEVSCMVTIFSRIEASFK